MALPFDISALERVLDDFVYEAKESSSDIHRRILAAAAAKGGLNGRLHLAAEKEIQPIHERALGQMVQQIVRFSAKTQVPLQELFEATQPKFAALNSAMLQPIQEVATTVFRSADQQNTLAREMAGAQSRLERRTASARQLQELEGVPAEPPVISGPTLINAERLAQLRSLASTEWDFTKLIRLCEELNVAYGGQCYFSTAMLTRSVLDHVPPIFGKTSFPEVANNYGGRSFKDSMEHLDKAARKVADAHLHMQIRRSETLPTSQQVDFASGLDVLLAEVVRITK